MTNTQFILRQDNDCHWYVIPVNKEAEWDQWLDLPDNDEQSWKAPDFAQEVGGSYSLVRFSEFEIK